jgi:ribosomal protein L11 methyltransferase
MALYCIQINPILSLEDAWERLEARGFSILYGEEKEASTEFYMELSDPSSLLAIDWITSYQEAKLPSIDWESQWALHGHDFYEGYVHIQLPNGKNLRLQPGPGFGDLSHPTTSLILELLKTYQQNQVAIDIGCGSGILAIAAAALGASKVYGIDIDPEALNHSLLNAQLNQVERQCHFVLPQAFELVLTHKPYLIFMNMIQSEQEIAWNSLMAIQHCQGMILTSGIRVEEKEAYLEKAIKKNWNLKEQKEKEGWLAFCFEC